MLERPDQFRLNPFAPLAQGLVFAGLGGYGAAGSSLYPDASGYGNHGMLMNMTPPTDWVWVPELGRWALDFDGSNDYVEVINQEEVDRFNTYPMSMACWFRAGNVAALQTMFSCASMSKYRKIGIGLDGASEGDPVFAYHGGSTADNYKIQSSSGINGDTTGWHHVLAVFRSATNRSIWLDGGSNANDASTYIGALGWHLRVTIGARGYTSLTAIVEQTTGRIADPLFAQADWTPYVQQLADPSNVMLSGLIRAPKRRLFAVSAAAPAFQAAWAIRRNQTIGTGVI